MKNCLVIAIMLILLSTSAFALTATTLSGMIQMNLESVPTTFEKSIGVKNENNETVQVLFIPEDDIKSMVSMAETNITLEPGEQRFVKFNLTAIEMKNITSAINIVFSRPNISDNETEEKFGIATKIVILTPKGETSNMTATNYTEEINNTGSENSTSGNNENSGNSSLSRYVLSAVIGLVAIILVIFIILKTKVGAKNE